MSTEQTPKALAPHPPSSSDRETGQPDVFVSHAGEDKAAVARPLAEALLSLGWDVWLDELRLTVGDSLSRQIDSALARSRFGVVVLSPSFFLKEWPQRELSGLAARELLSGAKVILPVWHEVDHAYIAERSPTLADRFGARTTSGIEIVAQELSVVLRGYAPEGSSTAGRTQTDDHDDAVQLFSIPVTEDEQATLIGEQSEWWEYRLYAGVLVRGRLDLEDKWNEHDLRLPGGQRRVAPEPSWEFLSREMGAMRRFITTFDRVFDPEVLEVAFGAPGEPGEADKIKGVARGVIHIYRSMMEWAAELRNTTVPREYVDLVELTARMADAPIRQIRDFIQLVADQIAQVPLLLVEAREGGATVESPMTLELALHLEIDQANGDRFYAELDRLKSA